MQNSFSILDYWSNLFTDKNRVYLYPDYPLMLPALIAYCWRVCWCYCAIYTLPDRLCDITCCAINCISKFIYQQGNDLFAFIALFIFIADIVFVYVASSQYADMGGFFILIVFILYKQIRSGASEQLVYLLGFRPGAGWVK